MPSAKDYLTVLLRGGAQNTAADAVAGLYGLARGGDVDAIRQAQDLLGYRPEGAEAEAAANIGEFLAPVTEPIGRAVDWVGERSPLAGAALHAAPIVAGAPAALSAGRGVANAASRVLAEELRRPSGGAYSQQGIFAPWQRAPGGGDASAAFEADRMLQLGEDPARVWRETGLTRYPGADPRELFYDAPHQIGVRRNMLGTDSLSGASLILNHLDPKPIDEVLFGRDLDYLLGEGIIPPHLRIQGDFSKVPGSASYDLSNQLITLGEGTNYSDLLNMAVHEITHGSQQHLGLPQGSSPRLHGFDQWDNKSRVAQSQLETLYDTLRQQRPELEVRASELAAQGLKPFPAKARALLDHRTLLSPNESRMIGSLAHDYERALEGKKKAFHIYQDSGGEAMARMSEYRRMQPEALNAYEYPFGEDYFRNATGSELSNLWHTNPPKNPVSRELLGLVRGR